MSKMKVCYTVLCCCCAFPLLLASLVLMFMAKKNLYNLSDNIENLGANWKQDAIMDVVKSKDVPLMAGQYIERWSGQFPGTQAGCHCPTSLLFRKVQKGLSVGSCGLNQTFAGCRDVKETPAVPLAVWPQNQEIFVVKQKGTSFFENFNKIRDDGVCEPGYKHCGEPGSKSKGLCIPESVAGCPVSDITTAPNPSYQAVQLQNLVLYLSRDNKHNPIVEATLQESHLCFSRSDIPTSEGRARYALLKGDAANCIKDESAVSVASIGEKELFDLNKVPYQSLVDYNPSNNFKYHLFVARASVWSPLCRPLVEQIRARVEDSKSLQAYFQTLMILYIVSFSLSLLCYLRIMLVAENKKGQYYCVFFLRLLLFIMVLPSIFIVANKCSKVHQFVHSISKQDCSVPEVNMMFQNLAEKFQSKVISITYWCLGTAFGGMFVELLMLLIGLTARKERVGYQDLSSEMNEIAAGQRLPQANPQPVPPGFNNPPGSNGFQNQPNYNQNNSKSYY